MNWLEKLIYAIETHSVKEVKECFENGIDPNDYFRNEPLLHELISEYTRGHQFKDCVKAFVEAGLIIQDHVLLSVLMNDDTSLEKLLQADPSHIHKKYSFRCAYTPLKEVTLLHICAEFNHVACAKVLVAYGTDVNVKAGTDEYGFGGQTPIFHTVNQNGNHSADMLQFLISQKADLRKTIAGLIWGKGYEWETFIPAVNPISYAMMGLLPQMHRKEQTISKVVTTLLEAAYGIKYSPQNVPCKYLQ